MKTLRDNGLYLAWLVALLGTVGLYFLGAIPDKLTWAPVIALASMTVALGVAAYFQDTRIKTYALPVLLIGAAFGAYRTFVGPAGNVREVSFAGLSHAGWATLALLVASALLAFVPNERVVRHTQPDPALTLAAVVAVVATLGSLYFSEVRHYVPCQLCWYQRTMMYPLALLLTMGVARGDDVRRFTLPLAVIGFCVAVYHVAEEKFGFAPLGTCSVSGGVSCTTQWINWLGFITIPVLSLSAFTLILGLLALPQRAARAAGVRELN